MAVFASLSSPFFSRTTGVHVGFDSLLFSVLSRLTDDWQADQAESFYPKGFLISLVNDQSVVGLDLAGAHSAI